MTAQAIGISQREGRPATSALGGEPCSGNRISDGNHDAREACAIGRGVTIICAVRRSVRLPVRRRDIVIGTRKLDRKNVNRELNQEVVPEVSRPIYKARGARIANPVARGTSTVARNTVAPMSDLVLDGETRSGPRGDGARADRSGLPQAAAGRARPVDLSSGCASWRKGGACLLC
jgi:hypothetical protein